MNLDEDVLTDPETRRVAIRDAQDINCPAFTAVLPEVVQNEIQGGKVTGAETPTP